MRNYATPEGKGDRGHRGGAEDRPEARQRPEEVGRFEGLAAYTEYRNTGLHRSPDIDNHGTPISAFGNGAAAEGIGESNPEWMREDAKNGAT